MSRERSIIKVETYPNSVERKEVYFANTKRGRQLAKEFIFRNTKQYYTMDTIKVKE